jgi:pantothenate kinase type III
MNGGFLTVDLGNSAIKLRRWAEGDGEAEISISWPGDWERALGEVLERTAPFDGIAGCSVAEPEPTRRVHALLRAKTDTFLPEPDPGLAIDCRDPHTIGRDRLYAARGGWELARGAALIVDAGTAVTVDALGSDHRGGVFLGGAIAPGPELLADALARGGANLFPVRPEPGARALGRDSLEALRAGVSVGFVGAVVELVRRIGREAGMEGAPVFLAGGARSFLEAPGLFGSREVRIVPGLVHRGLFAAAFSERSEGR